MFLTSAIDGCSPLYSFYICLVITFLNPAMNSIFPFVSTKSIFCGSVPGQDKAAKIEGKSPVIVP